MALCAVLLAAIPSPASAAVPEGNLVANPGFEQGPAATNATGSLPVEGWTKDSEPGPTAVRYGTPGGFPSVGVSDGILAGATFLAGGPIGAAASSSIHQVVDVSAAAPEIDAGAVQATLKGCLGGSEQQTDDVILTATTAGATQALSTTSVRGPDDGERSIQTSLLPVGTTFAVPPGTRRITIAFTFRRTSSDSYAEGYADQISLSFTPASLTDCTPAPPAAGVVTVAAVAATRSAAPSSLPSPAIEAARLRKDGRLSIAVRCASVGGRPCVGRLSLTTPRAGVRNLGAASFAIASGTSERITVRPSRATRRALRRLSAAQVRALRIRTVVSAASGAVMRRSMVGLR
jgi:hypothetical protein